MNRNVTFFIKSFLSVWAILIIYNLPVRNAFAIPAVILLGIFFRVFPKKSGKKKYYLQPDIDIYNNGFSCL